MSGWIDYSHTFTVRYGNSDHAVDFEALQLAREDLRRKELGDYLQGMAIAHAWRVPSEDWTADLRIDKRIFIEKLRSGELEVHSEAPGNCEPHRQRAKL